MSFLSRSKLNISENNTTLLSRLDESKSKLSTHSPISNDLMGSLDGFRQGLRRQLTEKLKTPSGNQKFLEVPSPKNSRSIKEKYDIGFSLKQRNSPIRVETSFGGRSTPSVSTKASQKHFDIVRDVHRKIEERSPPRKNVNKDLTLLASFDKKFTNGGSQNTFISPNYRSSLTKSTKSPLRDYLSTLESSKTPDYRRSQVFKSAYFDEKPSSRTPKDIKQNLIKILDHTPKRAATDSAAKLDSDRPHSALSQAFNQLRSSRVQLGNSSPERREGTESLKSLSNFVSDSFKNRERVEKTKKSSLFNGSADIKLDDDTIRVGGGSNLADKFSLSKVYDLQDLFQTAGEKDFNGLSSDYIEELIKLSSIIMQRVKTSSYYNRE